MSPLPPPQTRLHRGNVRALQLPLRLAFNQATVISVDCEFSGFTADGTGAGLVI
jgi:hypothetical protein